MLLSLTMVGLSLFGLRAIGYVTEPWLGREAIHRVRGEPERLGDREARPEAISIVTWNIRHGAKFDEVRSTLESLAADVYLLQEVDRACERTDRRDVAKDLADALDLNWVSAGEFQEIGEGRRGAAAITGQAVLSRFPIRDATAVRFRAQARFRWRLNPFQPRRGGRFTLKVRTAGLLIYNAHLESGRNERLRRAQLDELFEDLGREQASQVVIAGDLNNGPVVRSKVLSRLNASAFTDALGEQDRLNTSRRHSRQVDWIFVKSLQVASAAIRDTGKASDHFPVVATLSTDE